MDEEQKSPARGRNRKGMGKRSAQRPSETEYSASTKKQRGSEQTGNLEVNPTPPGMFIDQYENGQEQFAPPAEGGQAPYPNMMPAAPQPPPEQPTAASSTAPTAPPGSGPRLVALQCPQCPRRCPGVDAFREHMASVHGKGEGAAVQTTEEVPIACDTCDKSFKSRKSMITHRRRVHRIGQQGPLPEVESGAAYEGSGQPPAERRRGRPPKKTQSR